MKTWIIPVSWEMCGKVKIQANSLDEAIEIAENDSSIGLPEGDYVDASWKAEVEDKDFIRDFYNNGQEDELSEQE
ncbi:MAG: hypothetical protein II305_04420 [Clostridia bacterium]|nr:hypothetical protein [Clostridia bacterium]